MANLSTADIIKSHISAALAKLFTALPARVDSYDPDTRTISATPLIQRVFSDETGSVNNSIDDVPVLFPSAGGAEVTLPVKQGDTVLLVFSMRNIQDWLISTGDEVTPKMRRNHDINDAMAIPGIFTKQTARSANPDDLEVIFGDSKIQVKDTKIVIESGTIELGEGATEQGVLGNVLKDYLDTLTMPFSGTITGTSPSGPVTGTCSGTAGPPTTPYQNGLSDIVKVK